jgi:uncharacterized membrane protein YhdT
MTEFELLAIPLSLILGLGITNILSDVSDAIRDRERVALHWLPLFWAFLIFLFQVQYFFVLWDLYESGVVWTWPIFGPAMFNCIVLYLSAGLILPGRRNSDSESLLIDFEKHGRFGLLTLAMMLVVALILNVYYFSDLEGLYDLDHWLPAANILNLALLILICLVLFVRNIKLQTFGTVLFAMLQFYGMLQVWSLPGTT